MTVSINLQAAHYILDMPEVKREGRTQQTIGPLDAMRTTVSLRSFLTEEGGTNMNVSRRKMQLSGTGSSLTQREDQWKLSHLSTRIKTEQGSMRGAEAGPNTFLTIPDIPNKFGDLRAR